LKLSNQRDIVALWACSDVALHEQLVLVQQTLDEKWASLVVLHHLSVCLFCLLIVGMAHVVEIAFVRLIRIKDYVQGMRGGLEQARDRALNPISGTFLETLFFLGCFVDSN
jgi:hypothetical protein